jgi:hypothetical protein
VTTIALSKTQLCEALSAYLQEHRLVTEGELRIEIHLDQGTVRIDGLKGVWKSFTDEEAATKKT